MTINNLISINQCSFDELNRTNSIIQMLITNCMNKEFNREYYGIESKKTFLLSNERNDYLNMLEIISDKISHILYLQEQTESEICKLYNRTPTIAADK